MEHAPGGDLLNDIVKRSLYSEKTGREIIRQILDAVMFLHEHRIVHRVCDYDDSDDDDDDVVYYGDGSDNDVTHDNGNVTVILITMVLRVTSMMLMMRIFTSDSMDHNDCYK